MRACCHTSIFGAIPTLVAQLGARIDVVQRSHACDCRRCRAWRPDGARRRGSGIRDRAARRSPDRAARSVDRRCRCWRRRDTLNSICSSKAPNSSSVMMSPPPPLAATASSPFANDQPLAGNAAAIGAAPALRGLAVPQQAPALRLFLGVEVVRQVVADEDAHRRQRLEVLRLHARGSSSVVVRPASSGVLMLCTCKPEEALLRARRR